MAMNRIALLLLGVLKHNGANNSISAMSLEEIMEAEVFNLKPNSIYKKLKELETLGLISSGFKDGKANTFYLNGDGEDYLTKLKLENGE